MTGQIHVAGRSQIGIGERVTVSLLTEAIHLMPRPERVSAQERPYRSEPGEQAAE
jgi:hypothetical protein